METQCSQRSEKLLCFLSTSREIWEAVHQTYSRDAAQIYEQKDRWASCNHKQNLTNIILLKGV